MHVFDASSTISAWDNYPVRQFPTLWTWFAQHVQCGAVALPSVAFQEVGFKAPDCADWLDSNSVVKLPVTNAIARAALMIKGKLGVVNDRYGPGVDENDILIISTALIQAAPLVSDEAFQASPPVNLLKYKIPAVCRMDGVAVKCIRFIDFLKESEAVFG
jgi:predicted nucleic acid-binding protein